MSHSPAHKRVFAPRLAHRLTYAAKRSSARWLPCP